MVLCANPGNTGSDTEEGHVLSFNLSQSEVHYVLHMVERRLNSFMRDDGGGGFSDED